MNARRISIVLGAVAMSLAGPVGSVEAQSLSAGDFLQTLFRGTEFLGNHLFVSNPQGGPLTDFNIFRQRLEYNRDGDGWTYEFFRFFGEDSFGNPNTLDLGPFKIELGRDPGLLASNLPVGLHNRVGFTTRGIPEIFFDAETGQRGFNQFSGISTFAPAPINYRVTFNGGFQDLEWSGNVYVDSSARINALGFYDFDLHMVNQGGFEADGILLKDEQVTDIDVGPVNLSGHIVLDMIASLFQAGGNAVGAAGPRIGSGAAQRDKSVDEILAQIEAGEAVSQSDLQFVAEQMFLSAFREDPLGVILNGLPSEVQGFEGLSLASSPVEAGAVVPSSVPEPGTLLLLGAFAGGLILTRGMQRRLSR